MNYEKFLKFDLYNYKDKETKKFRLQFLSSSVLFAYRRKGIQVETFMKRIHLKMHENRLSWGYLHFSFLSKVLSKGLSASSYL